MLEMKQLINEIEKLPGDYYLEVVNFVEFLQLKSKRQIPETMLLSEKALAETWDTPEEDEAWAYL